MTPERTPDYRVEVRRAAAVLAKSRGEAAREKRESRWRALGIDPVVADKIYMAGYQCAYQQLRRKAGIK